MCEFCFVFGNLTLCSELLMYLGPIKFIFFLLSKLITLKCNLIFVNYKMWRQKLIKDKIDIS